MSTTTTAPTSLVPDQPSSTFSPPTSSTQSSSNSNPTSPGSQNGSPAGSELYLFTFLTTLLLLLGVSCAIIARSLILRRRFRRRVQEAIANGVLVPGLITEPMPKPLGEKPKMWNVWISDPENRLGPSSAAQLGSEILPMHNVLNDTLPVAAVSLDVPTPPKPRAPPSGRMPSHPRVRDTRPFYRRIIPRPPRPLPDDPANGSVAPGQAQQQLASSSQPNGTPTFTTVPGSPISDTSNSPSSTVQVSLLIAMPSAARSQYASYISQANSIKSLSSSSITPLPPHGSTGTQSQSPHPLSDASAPTPPAGLPSSTPAPPLSERDDKQTHRLSGNSIAKGKAPDHSHPHHGAWSHLEEGEIPYMEIGVLEVAMKQDSQSVNNQQQQSAVVSTGTGGAVW